MEEQPELFSVQQKQQPKKRSAEESDMNEQSSSKKSRCDDDGGEGGKEGRREGGGFKEKIVTEVNNKMEIDSNVEDDKVPTKAKLKFKSAVVNSYLKNENKKDQTPTKKM